MSTRGRRSRLRIRDLGVGTRLSLVFGLVAILFGSALGVALTSASTAADAADQAERLAHLADQVRAVRYFDADVSGWEAFVIVEAYRSGADVALAADGENLLGLRESRAELEAALAAVDTTLMTDAERASFTTLTEAWEDYWVSDTAMLAELARDDADGLAAATDRINVGESSELWAVLYETGVELSDSVARRVDAASARAADAVAGSRLAGGVAGALALAVGAALLSRTRRSITRPLSRAVDVLDAMAAGHLDRRLGLDTGDEMGRMSRALDAANDHLAATLRTVAAEARALAAASDDLAGTAVRLTGSAEDNGAQAAMLASAAAQVRATVDGVAKEADDLLTALRQTAATADTVSETADDAVARVTDAQATVAGLGAASSEIGAVVGTITGIADQTNLLALNATIEAARAGQAGRGFAVVAHEVKELAGQTASATDDIAQRIATIQAETAANVAQIEDVSAAIRAIRDSQRTVAAVMVERAGATDGVARAVADASREMTSMSGSIDRVALVAQQTAADAAASAAAAERLQLMSEELRELVGAFHT